MVNIIFGIVSVALILPWLVIVLGPLLITIAPIVCVGRCCYKNIKTKSRVSVPSIQSTFASKRRLSLGGAH